ncbi:MAG: copper resistance protein B [Proteobacteria bacterium]|nr:copper resistance protein B [Pseudomonadota bacterium]
MRVLTIAMFGAALSCPNLVAAQFAPDRHHDPTELSVGHAAMMEGADERPRYFAQGDRFEYRSNEGDAAIFWDGQAWVGGDLQKLWIKTEGDFSADGARFDDAELQALYSYAIAPFWDAQIGVRHDIKPDPSRSFATISLQGIAPYWFELDSALFVSNKADVSVRFEAEYDLRLTQRVLLQPRIELNISFSDDKEIGLGSGFSSASAELRLRYEISRQFAPYLGISWQRDAGDTADFTRRANGDVDRFSLVAGLRFWF